MLSKSKRHTLELKTRGQMENGYQAKLLISLHIDWFYGYKK